MPRIQLPSFVIHSGSNQLDHLSEAIQDYGPRLGLTNVRLLTPRAEGIRHNGERIVTKARMSRLYKPKHGIFNGVHHNLRNNLAITMLFGRLIMLAEGSGTYYHMPLMPEVPSIGTKRRPVVYDKIEHAMAVANGIRTTDEFISTLTQLIQPGAAIINPLAETKQSPVHPREDPSSSGFDVQSLLDFLAGPLRPAKISSASDETGYAPI